MAFVNDRFKLALEAIVKRITARYDYAVMYPCSVISQNGDGSLELKPDSAKLPGLSNIKIRYGIQGCTVKVSAGARVLLGFDNADPAAPFAAIWDPGSLTEIVITASTKVTINSPLTVMGDEAVPAARLGSTVLIPVTSPPGLPSYGMVVDGQPKVLV